MLPASVVRYSGPIEAAAFEVEFGSRLSYIRSDIRTIEQGRMVATPLYSSLADQPVRNKNRRPLLVFQTEQPETRALWLPHNCDGSSFFERCSTFCSMSGNVLYKQMPLDAAAIPYAWLCVAVF